MTMVHSIILKWLVAQYDDERTHFDNTNLGTLIYDAVNTF